MVYSVGWNCVLLPYVWQPLLIYLYTLSINFTGILISLKAVGCNLIVLCMAMYSGFLDGGDKSFLGEFI
jgi:hypothetical protein